MRTLDSGSSLTLVSSCVCRKGAARLLPTFIFEAARVCVRASKEGERECPVNASVRFQVRGKRTRTAWRECPSHRHTRANTRRACVCRVRTQPRWQTRTHTDEATVGAVPVATEEGADVGVGGEGEEQEGRVCLSITRHPTNDAVSESTNEAVWAPRGQTRRVREHNRRWAVYTRNRTVAGGTVCVRAHVRVWVCCGSVELPTYELPAKKWEPVRPFKLAGSE
jgi:hypothetical protein